MIFNIIPILSLLGFASLASALFTPQPLHALKIDDKCEKVEVIFARGSGDGEPTDEEAKEYFTEIERRLNNPIKSHHYALGTESYNGYKYPHVAVGGGWSYLTGINAFVTAGDHFVYKNSVNQGVNELQSYITQRHTKCMESDTLYVLGGYSQGAQVIGQALPKLNKNIRDDIVYIALFGDPKLHYPEGEGWDPAACRGERSVWRKVPVFNCHHDNGSLGSRKPYLPQDVQTKTGLWCYQKDMVCDPGAINQFSGHEEYKNEGRAIDHAAQIAVTRLQGRLKQDNPPPPPPIFPWEPTPEPPINYDQALNVHRVFNQGTTGENVVFAVDVSESMRHKLPAIKDHLHETIPKIIERGGRVALAVYWGISAEDGTVYTAGYGIPFEQDLMPLVERIGSNEQPEYLYPGSPLFVFNAAFNELHWTPGATKSLIAFSNNPLISPDSHGLTIEGIAKRALEIDPVNIYPVVPEELENSYIQLAEQTSGQILTYTDDIASAADQAFEKITKRPVPFLGNTEYIAEPGQEVTFDVSDSYVIDGEITKYDWDYDGDGQFEASTTTSLIKHTYNSPFTGLMQVRVTADNGTLANMSAKVTIGEITPPALPAAPQNLTHTITTTADNKSTVTITWDTNTEAHAWFIQINDMPMGYVQAGQTSLEITDIERSEDVIIGVASAVGTSAESFSTSTFSTTTVPKITPPAPEPEPPVTSTCTQSNFFVRLFCKTIAIFKYYLNGLWHYILPYRV